jgi:lipoate-protein ligase B
MNKSGYLIKVFNLEKLSFKKAFQIQKHLVDKQLKAATDNNDSNSYENSVILVEHDPPVYTVGLRKSEYLKKNELELLKQRLSGRKFHIEMTDRGGLITFHGPGQLVAYPILNLKNIHQHIGGPSLKKYVWQLEETIIDLCKVNFGLNANRMCQNGYTGVWLNDSKIAAIGVHYKKFITYHGIALNFNVDLDWFNYIVPCGISDKQVSSLTRILGDKCHVKSLNDLTPLFLNSFTKTFKFDRVVEADKDEVDFLIRNSETK